MPAVSAFDRVVERLRRKRRESFTGAWPELSTIVTVWSGAICVPTGGVTEMTLPAAMVSLEAVAGFAE